MKITQKSLRKAHKPKNNEGRGYLGGGSLVNAAAYGRAKAVYMRDPEAAEQRARCIYESLRPQIAAFPIKHLPPQPYAQRGRL